MPPAPAEKPRTSFMDLPKDIRMRIYDELSFSNIWDRAIHLNKKSIFDRRCLFDSANDSNEERYSVCRQCESNGWETEDEIGACKPSPGSILPDGAGFCVKEHHFLPVNLFRICRTWSNEAVETFYSRNKFKIFYLDTERLSALDNFRPTTLRALRNLTVRLSLSFCDSASDGVPCSTKGHHWDCHPGQSLQPAPRICRPALTFPHTDCKVIGHDAPLEQAQPRFKQILQDWTRFCQRLATSIEPGKLRLTMIVNTNDESVANSLLEPMRQLPALRQCAISLSKRYHPRLAAMAEEACLRIMGYPEPHIQDPFPFRKLPDELQLEVLRHTGLKAPFHMWCDRVKPGSIGYCDWGVPTQCIYQPDVVEDGGCVMCCTDALAHSSANPGCSCWTLSVAPLMVDRKMSEMAKHILYQENAWILNLTEFMKRSENINDYFGELLRHARHLQIHVSTNDEHDVYYEPGQRWHKLITRLKELHRDPSHLTFTLIMLHPEHDLEADPSYDPSQDSGSPLVWERVPRSIQASHMWDGHRSFADRAGSVFMVCGFRPKDIFVRILGRHHFIGSGNPSWDDDTRYESPLCDQRDFRHQEREIERIMMNDPSYDAEKRGKAAAVHESVDDVPAKDGTRFGTAMNSWRPWAHEEKCVLCGPAPNGRCAAAL